VPFPGVSLGNGYLDIDFFDEEDSSNREVRNLYVFQKIWAKVLDHGQFLFVILSGYGSDLRNAR
jgi:hypothetical protein